MASETELAAMRRAIELSARAHCATSPNPPVGCVVLDAGGATVGEGYHAYAGAPHAEVAALRQAGERARGGTLIVTLEPCAHWGRTPPCAQAVTDAGVHRVVVAVPDPSARAGGGAELLRSAGIEVETAALIQAAERANEEWLTYARTCRPFVTWKFAASLDGRVAAADGTSQWITGEEARADAHRLRATCDAIIVGSGTLAADDPRLTVRDAPTSRPPLRVVVDTEARTPPGARVLDDSAPTLVAVAEDAPQARTAALEAATSVLRLPRDTETVGLALPALLAELGAREVVSALLEGGPTLASSFLRAGLVDRAVGYLAPLVLGGGYPAVGDAGVHTLAAAHRLRFDDITHVGADLRLTARPTTDVVTYSAAELAADSTAELPAQPVRREN